MHTLVTRPTRERSDRGRPPDSDPPDDDLHGPEPDPEKIEAAQDRLNWMRRKIHRNTLETKDLRYLGSKCEEKI